MKKYIIDGLVAITLSVLFLIFMPWIFYNGPTSLLGYDFVQSTYKNWYGIRLNVYDAENVVHILYLMGGLILFAIYSITSFYKKIHERKLGPTLLALVVFLLGIELGYNISELIRIFRFSH